MVSTIYVLRPNGEIQSDVARYTCDARMALISYLRQQQNDWSTWLYEECPEAKQVRPMIIARGYSYTATDGTIISALERKGE